jgi:hypothetical protein
MTWASKSITGLVDFATQVGTDQAKSTIALLIVDYNHLSRLDLDAGAEWKIRGWSQVKLARKVNFTLKAEISPEDAQSNQG